MDSLSDDERLILPAAACGDLQCLQQLAEKANDKEAFRKSCETVQDSIGMNALHYTAMTGRVDVCKFLIVNVKASIDIITEREKSALLLALENGHTVAAKYLIVRGADIALSDSKGVTPLHYAAEKGSMELMQLLLLKGANIEAESVDGTPLQHAALCGNDLSVRFLLRHGANPNSASLLSLSPIISAITSNSLECFELLLKAGADPNFSLLGKSPLAYAASEGKMGFINKLLSAGANPNSVGTDFMTPIEHAAVSNKQEAVAILFPVTSRIRSFPDWSVPGILNYIITEEAKIQRQQKKDRRFRLASLRGNDAFDGKDYSDAIEHYSEAIYLDPADATLLSKRSRCWSFLDEAAFALHDAEACVKLRPDWPMAHYVEGVAWGLFQNYSKSATAFKEAVNLDPENTHYRNAFTIATALGLYHLSPQLLEFFVLLRRFWNF